MGVNGDTMPSNSRGRETQKIEENTNRTTEAGGSDHR
jgi:hypothetical protein